jgi:hypothetical protein
MTGNIVIYDGNTKTSKLKEVKVKKVIDFAPGIQLFIHREGDDYWQVSDAFSGCAVIHYQDRIIDCLSKLEEIRQKIVDLYPENRKRVMQFQKDIQYPVNQFQEGIK